MIAGLLVAVVETADLLVTVIQGGGDATAARWRMATEVTETAADEAWVKAAAQ